MHCKHLALPPSFSRSAPPHNTHLTAQAWMSTFVLSWLDYCSSLWISLTAYQTKFGRLRVTSLVLSSISKIQIMLHPSSVSFTICQASSHWLQHCHTVLPLSSQPCFRVPVQATDGLPSVGIFGVLVLPLLSVPCIWWGKIQRMFLSFLEPAIWNFPFSSNYVYIWSLQIWLLSPSL